MPPCRSAIAAPSASATAARTGSGVAAHAARGVNVTPHRMPGPRVAAVAHARPIPQAAEAAGVVAVRDLLEAEVDRLVRRARGEKRCQGCHEVAG